MEVYAEMGQQPEIRFVIHKHFLKTEGVTRQGIDQQLNGIACKEEVQRLRHFMSRFHAAAIDRGMIYDRDHHKIHAEEIHEVSEGCSCPVMDTEYDQVPDNGRDERKVKPADCLAYGFL